ncbi:baseplate J/gp47 family protein [Undibacterium sp. SXout20W]|uniref:baseplate J/gp47 family protein n=1 Tax=Undibacterium sp. SXout20W TaxID=3413051 RepID=UPI003BEF7D8B
MPFNRPTLSALQASVASDIAQSVSGVDPLLRFSNLNITATAQAGLAHLHYGYLDWIAKQAVPFTCTDEYLEGWAALKSVYRQPATQASGVITFTAGENALLPAGSVVVRGDGQTCVTLSDARANNGTIVVNAQMAPDPSGVQGAFGNTAVGVSMTLSQAVSGIQATGVVSLAFTGGADIESNDSLKSRMLFAYQNPPKGGALNDYIQWASSVPGVTRAWCLPNSYGPGTVVIYVMFDVSNAANNGFPQGKNGVATNENRGATATGDLLSIANYILPLQPVTALVYLVAPAPAPVNLTIKGVPESARSAVQAAISSVLFSLGDPTGSTIPLAQIWSAIANNAGVSDFLLVSPAADIVNAVGTLSTLGTITFT